MTLGNVFHTQASSTGVATVLQYGCTMAAK